MSNKLKTELEKRLYMILKNKNNSSTYSNDELKDLTELLREFNKSNYKNITFTDLLPSVAFLCATSILIAILIKLL